MLFAPSRPGTLTLVSSVPSLSVSSSGTTVAPPPITPPPANFVLLTSADGSDVLTGADGEELYGKAL